MGYDPSRFVGGVDDEFLCSICSMIFDRPVDTPCEHTFCDACIKEWLTKIPQCPIDYEPLAASDLKLSGRRFRNLMAKLNIKCDFFSKGCDAVVPLDQIATHSVSCEQNPYALIECNRGCNRKIGRHEQEMHSCIALLLHQEAEQKIEIQRLQELDELNRGALEEQKIEYERLQSEYQRLDEQHSIRFMEIDELRHRQNLPFPNTTSTAVAWQIVGGCITYCGDRNTFEGTDNSELLWGSAQSKFPLTTGSPLFKMEFLHTNNGGFGIGLAPSSDNPKISEKNSIGYQNDGTFLFQGIRFLSQEKFLLGDIIECGIYNPENLNDNESTKIIVYFCKNGKLITERSFRNVHMQALFPTIWLYGIGSKVKILSN